MKKNSTARNVLVALAVWQFISIFFIAIAGLPVWIIYLNVILLSVYIIVFETFDSILLLVLSIPFYVAIPNHQFDSLSMWRVLFAVLFLVWLVRIIDFKIENLKKIWIGFFEWDIYLGVFIFIAACSVLYARYQIQSLKLLVFYVNVYLLYFVMARVIQTKNQLLKVIQYAAISLCIIIFLGYVQLFATFFSSTDTFWVYWASFISKLFYGQTLASVLLYSNSWFSYSGGGTELRMFSIQPDSHSFALLAVYCIGFLLPFTYLSGKKTIFGYQANYLLWSIIRFAGLAIVLSGTRAVWVGLLAPFVIVSIAWNRKFMDDIAKKKFWTLVLIVLFFLLSPFINQGLHFLQVRKFEENFVDRAKSIYDLKEQSNAGRIEIWKSTLRYAVRHPLGTGLNNFIVSLNSQKNDTANFQQLSEAHNAQFNLPQKFVTAHNIYLHVWTEMGVLGLISFVAFWIYYYRAVWNFIKAHNRDNNILIFFVIETALTFLWFLAAGVFDVTFFNDKILIYFFISLALSGIIIKNYDRLKAE